MSLEELMENPRYTSEAFRKRAKRILKKRQEIVRGIGLPYQQTLRETIFAGFQASAKLKRRGKRLRTKAGTQVKAGLPQEFIPAIVKRASGRKELEIYEETYPETMGDIISETQEEVKRILVTEKAIRKAAKKRYKAGETYMFGLGGKGYQTIQPLREEDITEPLDYQQRTIYIGMEQYFTGYKEGLEAGAGFGGVPPIDIGLPQFPDIGGAIGGAFEGVTDMFGGIFEGLKGWILPIAIVIGAYFLSKGKD
jgi:tRNA(Leu) C34 or U34 (ribose-2'-O)-methylase TrmL